jgi:hypothetical protein
MAVGEAVRRRVGEGAGILAYATSTVLFNWIGYDVTEPGIGGRARRTSGMLALEAEHSLERIKALAQLIDVAQERR